MDVQAFDIAAHLGACFAMESFGESRESTELSIRPPFVRRVRIRSDPRQGRFWLDELCPDPTRSQEKQLLARVFQTWMESAHHRRLLASPSHSR